MDTLFFVASKLVGALIRPDTWIVLAFGLILLALLLGRRRLAFWTALTAFLAVLGLAILPVADPLLRPIERIYPVRPELSRVDGIIVLGGGEDNRATAFWQEVQLNEGAERYTAALELARRFPQARLMFTGGSGALRDLNQIGLSEAAIAGRFFREQGIAEARLLLEGRSRNTAENARLGLALADPATDETWVLITSAFHMPRAMRSFQSAGWTGLVPWPVDYRSGRFSDGIGWRLTEHMRDLNTAIRAHVGQLAYRLTGR